MDLSNNFFTAKHRHFLMAKWRLDAAKRKAIISDGKSMPQPDHGSGKLHLAGVDVIIVVWLM
ncbi:MAG: hypothetical protein ACLS6C_03190 [Clostridia bacterium]